MKFIVFLIGSLIGGYAVYHYIKNDTKIQAQVRDETIKNLKAKIERLETQSPKKTQFQKFKN